MGQHLWAECVYESWDVLRILRRFAIPQMFCDSSDVLRIRGCPAIPGMFYESSDVLRFFIQEQFSEIRICVQEV
jgi:hypothetical protein